MTALFLHSIYHECNSIYRVNSLTLGCKFEHFVFLCFEIPMCLEIICIAKIIAVVKPKYIKVFLYSIPTIANI